ncbi:MAG: FAD-dependent thymidylate synthase [Rhodobacteraceae bacterium]|nr:FAD-dependent thymidylate synthase [Paracoccaceae bacterium]
MTRVLDHGFIRVVDRMGNDAAIVQAARVSYGSGTKTPSDDVTLIRYLMRHGHTSPFEMCEVKFHIKLPIFVARQWLRHRTASINEYSARYSEVDNEFYIPEPETLGTQGIHNKQGRSGSDSLDRDVKRGISRKIESLSEDAHKAYERLRATDLARETARVVLPVNVYTRMYWKVNLHNLFHFLKLRMADNAQYEIRQYAKAIGKLVRDWVPVAYQAFEDYQLNSVILSAMEVEVLGKMLRGEKVDKDATGMSKREWKEFEQVWGAHG